MPPDQLLQDLQSWDDQSEHRTGTQGDLETSRRLVSRLSGAPLAPSIVQYPMVRRVPKNCFVTGSSFQIEGIPLFDCNPTDNGSIQGSLTSIGESGDIAVGTLSANSGNTESRRLLSARSETTYRALIGISQNETAGISIVNADRFTNPFGLPLLMIDGFDATPLQEALKRQDSVTLSLEFEEQRAVATNVELVIRGRNPRLAPVVVMTPKSSWWTSTAERIGGIVAWISSIRRLSVNQPLRTVIFTANSGHELGHTGLHSFLERHGGLATSAHIWVHLGANLGANDSQLRLQVSEDRLTGIANEELTKQALNVEAFIPKERRPGGESRDIFDAGGRYVSLIGSNHLFHHPDDRLANNVDIKAVTSISLAVSQLVCRFANE